MRQGFAAVTGAKRPLTTQFSRYFLVFVTNLTQISCHPEFFVTLKRDCLTLNVLTIQSTHNLKIQSKIFNPYWLVARIGSRP